MKTITKLFLLCSFIYFLNVNAQAPNKFSFQAIVRNSSNQLITNQPVGVKISLISVVMSTENAEFVETHTVTTNANGLFSLKVGEGTLVSGDFATAMNSNAYSKKIKCEIDPTGGTNYTIVSNEQLLSVPYALFANTAASTTSNNSWKITGNSNIDPATQFIGTTDFNDLQFKVDSQKSGIIEANDGLYNNTIKSGNTSWGFQALFSNQQGGFSVVLGWSATCRSWPRTRSTWRLRAVPISRRRAVSERRCSSRGACVRWARSGSKWRSSATTVPGALGRTEGLDEIS